jgi:DNA recombination protein RmuC
MDSTATLLLILIITVLAGVGFLFLRLNKRGGGDEQALQLLQNQLAQLTSAQNEKLDRTLTELNSRLREQNQTLNEQLQKSQLSLQQQFSIAQKTASENSSNTAKIVQQVTEKLTKLDETNKQVVGFAEQLQSLENILKNPKHRGILGEYYLETVIKNVLPPDSYKLQFKFNNGEIVDALIITREGNIPVDAKFSLENYNRLSTAESKEEREKFERLFKEDLKKRIDETSKYIRPQEKTLDFAFMFIPADGLYYDLLVQRVGGLDVNQAGLIDYAFKKRVLIVSPTTFFAYLQTVMQGLRALQIEESTKQIQKDVEALQRHLRAYEDYIGKVGKNLNATVGAYNSSVKEFGKIDKDLMKISTDKNAMQVDVEDILKPELGLED